MWLGLTPSQWFSLVGLGLDLVGAVLVASEVVRRFRGELVRRKGGIEHVDVDIPETTPEYRAWEARKHKAMAWGLSALVAGFLLQMVGVVLRP